MLILYKNKKGNIKKTTIINLFEPCIFTHRKENKNKLLSEVDIKARAHRARARLRIRTRIRCAQDLNDFISPRQCCF